MFMNNINNPGDSGDGLLGSLGEIPPVSDLLPFIEAVENLNRFSMCDGYANLPHAQFIQLPEVVAALQAMN